MIDYIITPTNQFNHKFLRTIDSVLNQTCDSWIWLIVNDSNKSIYDSRNSEEVIRLISSDSRENFGKRL